MLINIIGASGTGKTTLANNLIKILGFPCMSIGKKRQILLKYRDYGLSLDTVEETSWAYFNSFAKFRNNCIITHSGLNSRWVSPKRQDKLTIKLKCSLKDAMERATEDKGQSIIFKEYYDFSTFEGFISYSNARAITLKSDITINTSKHGKIATTIIALYYIIILYIKLKGRCKKVGRKPYYSGGYETESIILKVSDKRPYPGGYETQTMLIPGW